MPIQERDYMKRPPAEGQAERVGVRKERKVNLFRLLIVLWLSYLTVKTHDVGEVWERTKRIASGLGNATSEFFQSAKGVITESPDSEEPDSEIE